MRPEVGQVVTVFRSRLRPDAVAYADDAAQVAALAKRRGIADYYQSYSIQVGNPDYASAFPRA
jgi:hypothetical protein